MRVKNMMEIFVLLLNKIFKAHRNRPRTFRPFSQKVPFPTRLSPELSYCLYELWPLVEPFSDLSEGRIHSLAGNRKAKASQNLRSVKKQKVSTTTSYICFLGFSAKMWIRRTYRRTLKVRWPFNLASNVRSEYKTSLKLKLRAHRRT